MKTYQVNYRYAHHFTFQPLHIEVRAKSVSDAITIAEGQLSPNAIIFGAELVK